MARNARRQRQAQARARAQAGAQRMRARKQQRQHTRGAPRKGVTPGVTRRTTPAQAGVPYPRTEPFMGPDDLMAQMQFGTNQREQSAQTDYELATQEAQNAYQAAQLTRQAQRQRSSVNDSAAARGLFQSSIRDAALFDITGQETVAKSALDTALKAARTRAEALRTSMGQSALEFNQAMHAKMTANAREINAGLPQWSRPPTAASTTTVPGRGPAKVRRVSRGARPARPTRPRSGQRVSGFGRPVSRRPARSRKPGTLRPR